MINLHDIPIENNRFYYFYPASGIYIQNGERLTFTYNYTLDEDTIYIPRTATIEMNGNLTTEGVAYFDQL